MAPPRVGAQASRKAWLGLAGVVATLAVVAALLAATRARERFEKPLLDAAQSAYERSDFSETVAITRGFLEREPRNVAATRLQARAEARRGRWREAIDIYAKLDGASFEADDLVLLSRHLNETRRPTLGRAALDAASKIGPTNADGAAQLSSSSVERAGLLDSVPSGPALAELVVALARLDAASPASDPDPTLRKLLRRGRDVLQKVDTPSAARKLMARLFLDEGRTAEARRWLVRVTDPSDPEAHWLLSRACLVEGDMEGAAAALKSAGAFGRDDPTRPEPGRYAGAKSCAGCHGAIYRAQQNSRHASTLAEGDALKSVPLPPDDVTDPEEPAVVHRFGRTGADVQVEADVRGRPIRAAVDYALGSGRHGVTMLAKDKTNKHRSLRISYYSGGHFWGLTSGFEPHPKTAEGFIGEALSDESFAKCLNCHSTRFTTAAERTGPEAADHGIGCEKCHGPGENHLKAVEHGFAELAIARPKAATPAQRLKICARCHGADGIIPPSDPRFVRFQGANLLYSRCVTESGGRLDCVACHDPHRNLETTSAYYEARCLACHSGERPAPKPGPGVRVEAVAAARCPVNATNGCIDCHMPRVEKTMPFTTFTDHHIRVHRDRLAGVGASVASP